MTNAGKVAEFHNVSRITLVDDKTGRVFERFGMYENGVEIHLQDDGRTLKIFPKQKGVEGPMRIGADFYIGELSNLDSFYDQLPEYMLEYSDLVRTHTVDDVRWDSGGLSGRIVSSEDHRGNDCCGGANVLFSHKGKFFIREVSFGH